MITAWTSETIAAVVTAVGTLVLAVATFWSVRSSNRSARIAERSVALSERALNAGVRPFLMPSRAVDGASDLVWADGWVCRLEGGHAIAERHGDDIYLALALRNSGSGTAVVESWDVAPGWDLDMARTTAKASVPTGDCVRPLTRDLFVPGGEPGCWQAALRDPSRAVHGGMAAAIEDRKAFTLDLRYCDQDGGQTTITRFAVTPLPAGTWTFAVVRYWPLA